MLIAALASVWSAQGATPQSLRVQEFTLSNGLKVWINEDHAEPKVFGALVVRAGAKDCPDTGIAHYFEHIMFKGTDKIGTIDFAAEKLYLDSISQQYDLLAQTADEAVRKAIQTRINELSIASSDYVIPNEFDRLISRYGGSGLNAYTSFDETVYFNTFSPQYFAQWAELNSERVISPVFRLFQSELETVYEEKNMYSDQLGALAMEKALERYFSPHPYAYPIVGSTEHLKNPRLSDMAAFFDKYYVAANMGLVLSGDVVAADVLPTLEKTFGRIRAGEAKPVSTERPAPFNGREQERLKVPIPLVKAMVLGWRGVPKNDPDEPALNIAVKLLSNSNGTGLLDKLMKEGKVQISMALAESMNDAGFLAAAAVAKPFGGSYDKLEKLIWAEVNKLISGDFTDAELEALKLDWKIEREQGLEKVDSRSRIMIDLISQGKTWEGYLDEVRSIEELTKQDVMAAAKKYFSQNYIAFTKKTGNYPKEKIEKPAIKPIVPKNPTAESEYAAELAKIPVKEAAPRFIDVEKDVTTAAGGGATVYAKANGVNDIYSVEFAYGRGEYDSPKAKYLAWYLEYANSESMTQSEFNAALQQLGARIQYTCNFGDFRIKLTGVESNFAKAMQLASDFLWNLLPEDKEVKKVYDMEKTNRKTERKSIDAVSSALVQRALYGAESRNLRDLSLREVKKLKGAELTAELSTILTTQCDVLYSGSLSAEQVAQAAVDYFKTGECTRPSSLPLFRDRVAYQEPVVFFCNDPKAVQSIVNVCMSMPGGLDPVQKDLASLYNNILGGDMTSVLFQEIREFRSYAYSARSSLSLPPTKLAAKNGILTAYLSTQADKTFEAMDLMDSMIRQTPLTEARLMASKQLMVNRINNGYPSFRTIPDKVATIMRNGDNADPNIALYANLEAFTLTDVEQFHQLAVPAAPAVYVVVGNSQTVSTKELAKYGKVTVLKVSDIFRK